MGVFQQPGESGSEREAEHERDGARPLLEPHDDDPPPERSERDKVDQGVVLDAGRHPRESRAQIQKPRVLRLHRADHRIMDQEEVQGEDRIDARRDGDEHEHAAAPQDRETESRSALVQEPQGEREHGEREREGAQRAH